MRVKRVLTILELLATTGVVSVGFSSWAMITGNSINAQIEVLGDDLLDTDKYFLVKNIDMSDHAAVNGYYGFYTNHIYTKVLSNVAIIEFDIIFDYTRFYSNFYSNTSDLPSDINVTLNLSYISDCYDIIGESVTDGITLSYGLGFNTKPTSMTDAQTISPSTGLKGNYLLSDFDINISNSYKESDLKIYLSFKYQFTLKTYEVDGVNTGIGSENRKKLRQYGMPLNIFTAVEEY